MLIKNNKVTSINIESICNKYNLSPDVVKNILYDYKKMLISYKKLPNLNFMNIELIQNEQYAIIIPDRIKTYSLFEEIVKCENYWVIDVSYRFPIREKCLNVNKLYKLPNEVIADSILFFYPVINNMDIKNFVYNHLQVFRNIIYLDYTIQYMDLDTESIIEKIATSWLYDKYIKTAYELKDNNLLEEINLNIY